MSWNPVDWVDGIGNTFIKALQYVWHWVLDALLTFGQSVIGLVIDLLPTDANGQVQSGWSTIESSLLVANAWAPLDFAIGLCPVYVAFVLAHLSIKVLIKLIP